MTPQSFSVPFPPSVNAMYKNISVKGKRGRAKSKAYLEWEEAAGWDVQRSRVKPIAGSYELTITLGRPDNRPRDNDNYIKAISDLCVKHGLVRDDCHSIRTIIQWGGTKGRAQVTICPVPVEYDGAAE